MLGTTKSPIQTNTHDPGLFVQHCPHCNAIRDPHGLFADNVLYLQSVHRTYTCGADWRSSLAFDDKWTLWGCCVSVEAAPNLTHAEAC